MDYSISVQTSLLNILLPFHLASLLLDTVGYLGQTLESPHWFSHLLQPMASSIYNKGSTFIIIKLSLTYEETPEPSPPWEGCNEHADDLLGQTETCHLVSIWSKEDTFKSIFSITPRTQETIIFDNWQLFCIQTFLTQETIKWFLTTVLHSNFPYSITPKGQRLLK